MKKYLFSLTLILLVLAGTAKGDDIKVVTEHLPPMQIAQGSKVVGGIGYEVVQMLLRRAGSESRIVAVNWARAYQMALTQPNVMIFSVTRNQERENQLKWVGPVASFDDYLWRLESRDDIVVNDIHDAMAMRVAVPRDDMQHQMLKRFGFLDNQNLVITAEHETAVRLILRNRVELLSGNRLFLNEQLKNVGHDISRLTPVFKLKRSTLYIAFSQLTDDAIVEHYSNALEQVKLSERYRLLMEKWQLD